jgi:hypothetical protein
MVLKCFDGVAFVVEQGVGQVSGLEADSARRLPFTSPARRLRNAWSRET